jgi:small subunit ribosomal protein S6
MNIYENFVILNASLSDEEITAAVSRIKDLVITAGGEVIRADHWGRRKLSYEIKKQTKGFYVLFVYKAPAATIKKLEELYKVFDPVIKFMVIKLGTKQIKHLEKSLATEAEQKAAAEKAATEKVVTEQAVKSEA